MRDTFLRSLVIATALVFGCDGAVGGADDLGTEQPDITGRGSDGGVVLDESGTSPTTVDDGTVKVGKGGSTPFDPSDAGSSGVKLDPSGSVVLDPTAFGGGAQPVIWVANSEEGTVSKVDTRTMKEVARYRTADGSPDPSRTTIALNGDAVVVNRGGASATKIATNPIDCVGAGAGTSTGPTDVRAWGDDKCVLWNTPFAAGSLGRAAAFDAEKGLDGELSTSVWVGLWTSSKMLQLDSKTGKILAEVDVSPVKPYGAAVDSNHHVWVWGGGVGFIDAATKKWTRIEDSPCAYGIAVDPKGRVWTSGGGCVARYTPSTSKWEHVAVGSSNRGLAVDAKGSVWVADTSFGVHQIDLETLTVVKDLSLGSVGVTGAAIDFDGMVWIIDQTGSRANKIDPKDYSFTGVVVGQHPYTYSDMTGFQLRNSAAPFGKYLQTFPGCGAGTNWQKLSWEATTAPGTSISVRVRTAKTVAALATATWQVVAKVPGDTPPIDLAAKLGDAAKNPFIQVEFELNSSSASITPILSAISVKSYCPGEVH